MTTSPMVEIETVAWMMKNDYDEDITVSESNLRQKQPEWVQKRWEGAMPLCRLSDALERIAQLEADARRYQVLRNQRHGFRAYRLNPKPGKRWRGWSEEGDIHKGEALDAAIDAAMGTDGEKPAAPAEKKL